MPGSRKIWFVLLSFCLVALAVALVWYFGENRLHGLLIDLELEGPDPSRYRDLRTVLTTTLPNEEAVLRNTVVTLEYIHFADLNSEAPIRKGVDFVVLSPQGTPWHMYRDERAVKLRSVEKMIRELIEETDIPVLGICGGHQFLALAFGGTVGFMDPKLTGLLPERYPKSSLSEKGIVFLDILREDPILNGVTLNSGRFRALQNHYEEVKVLPERFVNLARSEMSEAQLIRFADKPVYGMAFHPERAWGATRGADTHEGRQILANFLRIVAERNRHGRH